MHIFENPPPSLSSDLTSYRRRVAKGDTDDLFPCSAMRWGLCATAGAFTTFHIDADGLATYIACINEGGSKWWILVGPKDSALHSPFSNAEKMFAFHNSRPISLEALGDVQVEAVLLTPGTRL